MLLTLTAASPEIEDFVIELQIDSDATFADLHQLIRQTCGWGKAAPSTFYVCDDRWRRERTIPESGYEDDTMEEVELGDLLEDEGQRLQYVFDPDEERGLLLEVTRIAFGKSIGQPRCRRQHGEPPALVLIKEERPKPTTNAELLAALNAAALADEDEDEFTPSNDEDFEMDEIDPEGFDFTEG